MSIGLVIYNVCPLSPLTSGHQALLSFIRMIVECAHCKFIVKYLKLEMYRCDIWSYLMCVKTHDVSKFYFSSMPCILCSTWFRMRWLIMLVISCFIQSLSCYTHSTYAADTMHANKVWPKLIFKTMHHTQYRYMLVLPNSRRICLTNFFISRHSHNVIVTTTYKAKYKLSILHLLYVTTSALHRKEQQFWLQYFSGGQ